MIPKELVGHDYLLLASYSPFVMIVLVLVSEGACVCCYIILIGSLPLQVGPANYVLFLMRLLAICLELRIVFFSLLKGIVGAARTDTYYLAIKSDLSVTRGVRSSWC